MADLKTSDSLLDPVGAGYHPPIPESDQDLEVRELDTLTPELLNVRWSRDTGSPDEYENNDGNEKGTQDVPQKLRHVGFWHHDLVNVRLHVIKLWARTGMYYAGGMPGVSVDYH